MSDSYRTVRAITVEELERDVSRWCETGEWVAIGGPVFDPLGNRWVQAVVKSDPKPELPEMELREPERKKRK